MLRLPVIDTKISVNDLDQVEQWIHEGSDVNACERTYQTSCVHRISHSSRLISFTG